MEKIYLAISNSKPDEPIHSRLKQMYANAEIKTIPGAEELNSILVQPFDLLIVDRSYIEDISLVSDGGIKGSIWYINPENKMKIAGEGEYVSFFGSNSEVREFLDKKMIGSLINTDLKKKKTIGEGRAKVSSIPNNKPPRVSQSIKPDSIKKKEKPAAVNLQKETKESKETQKQDDNEVPNDSRIVEFNEAYPLIAPAFFRFLENAEEFKRITQNIYPEIDYTTDEKTEKAIAIRKAQSGIRWNGCKTIGIWSPSPRIGVTTFTMNYGMYLGKKNIDTAVLEGINNRFKMKSELLRFTDAPEDWASFLKTVSSEDINAGRALWSYRNVLWYPIDFEDFHGVTLNSMMIFLYFFTVSPHSDIRLVDLPTGEMQQYTLDTLQFIDELWILVDGDDKDFIAWKDFIHEDLINTHNIKIQLILVNQFKHMDNKIISENMELPVLAEFPPMFNEYYRHRTDSIPFHETFAWRKMKKQYKKIFKEIMETSYKTKSHNMVSKIRSVYKDSLD